MYNIQTRIDHLLNTSGYGLMLFVAVALSLSTVTLYSDFSITNFVYAHDGDGDGIDDDTLLPVVDEASNDPFPGSGKDFTATFSSGAIVGVSTNSTATGTASLVWSENQERLRYEITFSGITLNSSEPGERITAIHIHRGETGSNGGHALNIYGVPCSSDPNSAVYSENFPVCDDLEMEVDLATNTVTGVWGEIDAGQFITSEAGRSRQLSDMREELCNDALYFQTHSNWNPMGAIRGQIKVASELCDFQLGQNHFSSTLNGAQVTAAGGTAKSGITATATAHFNHTQGALYYRIDFASNVNLNSTAGITGNEVTKIHIHEGAAGSSGDHLLNVFGAPCFDTSGNALHPLSDITDICDDAQMEVNLVDNVITGIWDDTDRTTGGVTTDHSRSKKLSDHIGDLCNDRTYIQVHFTDGNIRGQIELDDHDLCDFDPNHSDFTAVIDESQIYHAGNMTFGTGSSATGTADFRFSSHYDELQYDIYFEGLDTDDVQTVDDDLDDLTAIHFHQAPAGSNGPVHLLNIFGTPEFSDNDYTLQPGSGTIYGIWDDNDESTVPSENGRTKKLTDSIDTLCAGEVYINVHTAGFAHGEIRGQILKTPDNVMCDFKLNESPDFTGTLNECKVIRATINNSHSCIDDGDGGHDDGGHGHGSSVDPEADVSMWFNDAMTELYYTIEFTGVDTTGEQTQDGAGDDDLKAIHVHIGDEFSEGGHAFNIIAPFDDDDMEINNGTRVVSGIWGNNGADDDVSAGPNTGTNLDDYYPELCSDELYIQIHNVTGASSNKFMRGQIEVNGHHNNVCDAPELLSASAIAPTKVLLIFDKGVDTSTSPFGTLNFGEPLSSVGYTVHNNGTNPNGHGVVTLITSSSLTGTSDGDLTINATLEDLIENGFDTSANPVTVTNALGGAPVEVSASAPSVVITSDSTLDELMVPDGVDATLDLTSTASTPSTGKTQVTVPSEITTTVGDGTSDEVQIVLPAGLEVTGNSAGFDGVLSLPSKSTCNATLLSGESANSCVEIGVPGVELSLSAPVKITLPGEAGSTPFFSTVAGTRTVIDTWCGTPDTWAASGPTNISSSDPRECFYNDPNGDLIIWTMHFTSFGSISPEAAKQSFGGGGRGAIANLLAPNLILYNTCNENIDGIARVLAFTHESRGEISVRTHIGDYLSHGIDVTDSVSYKTYVDRGAPAGYDFHIFDVAILPGADSFWITVDEIGNSDYNVPHLVTIPKDSCIGFDEAFDLRGEVEYLKPFEPLEVPKDWGISQELVIEEIPIDENRTIIKWSDDETEILVEEAPETEILVEEAPETEILVEEAPETEIHCGAGTTIVDGICELDSEIDSDTESQKLKSSGLFDQILKWFGF